jgi:hypothetical protein
MCASIWPSMVRLSVIERAAYGGLIISTTCAALLAGVGTVYAGPCAKQISQVEQQIRRAQASSPPGGAGAPSAPQSVGAQLHHQPTPGSVQNAEQQAKIDSEAALNRARNADAAGDASACAQALREAKQFYGIE